MTKPNKIDVLKKELLHQRDELTNTVNRTHYDADERSLKDSVDELSSYDNHPADLGTELFDREKDHAIGEHSELELEKVNLALQAIEDGTYGKCKVCGTEIPFERLEVIPYTLYCIKHTPDREIATDRPVEEQILTPPFNNSYDTHRNSYVNDSQDSFQEVARYGTSESPSDFTGDHDDFSDLYDNGDDQEGFTEDMETFVATDISGENIQVYPSKAHEEYEQVLDDENIESPLGDIPYKKTDGYEDN